MSQSPQTLTPSTELQPWALPRIAARVFDTPLLIHEGKLHQILAVLGPRLGFDLMPKAGLEQPAIVESEKHAAMAAQMVGGVRWEWNRDGGYYNAGRAAVIPVTGTLVQRTGYFDALSGMRSYETIERAAQHAQDDYSVDELVFDYDTPGGEAAGAFDAADRLSAMRGSKPMTAVVNELSASAGYLLASTADKIIVPRTGYAGSVGVVTAHVDMSAALEKRGMVVTFVYAGAKKVDGNPYAALSERVKAEWQKEIDEMYGIFVETVAKNRKIESAAVRSTEAGMFMGRAAVEAGFADSVNTLSNLVHNLSLRRGGMSRLSHSTETTMTDAERAQAENDKAAARAEGVAQGKKDATASNEAAVNTAKTEAAKAERTRIKAIVTNDEAKGRADLASHLAFETEQPAEAAIALLKAAPKGQAAKGPLATAMEQLGTPGIRSLDTPTNEKKPAVIDHTAIYGKLNAPQAAPSAK